MALFKYRAVDGSGGEVRGLHEAPDRSSAMDQLEKRELFVTKLEESREQAGKFALNLSFLPIVQPGEIVLFNRRLATLVASDIPLLESLSAIETQMENKRFRQVLVDVKEAVRQGRSFSDAISRHPRVFPELMVSMVRVGETGGILAPVLEQLADFTERDNEIRSEVRTALAYPGLVLTLAVGTVFFLMVTVVPRLSAMFESMRVTLPAPTRLLMAVSGFLGDYGLYLLGALVVAVFFFWRWVRTEAGREAMDQLQLRTPLMGTLVRKAMIARFARSLAALVRGGVPLMEGLQVVNHVLNNRVLSRAVDRVMDRVRKGESMARAMKGETLFPDMVKYMVSSGEESGHLDDMLGKVADIYEMETRRAIKLFVNLLSPVLILMVAAVVGFIAFAMLLPIFQINRMIG